MLAEYFLSPDIFEAEELELRRRLDELQDAFLPRRNISTFVACQLGCEKWQLATRNSIRGIKNSDLRSKVMVFFERLVSEASVHRPLSSVSDPQSAVEWLNAAKESSDKVCLDGILAANHLFESDDVLSMNAFYERERFERYSNPRFVEYSEAAQSIALRTICLHADWLILRLPQIRGGMDDEIVTVKQVIKLSSNRFPEQRKCHVEVHIPVPPRIPKTNLKMSVERELDSLRGGLAELSIKMLDGKQFIDRELLAGEWAIRSDNDVMPRARWLITMSHVAVGSRRNGITPATWSLFGRKDAHQRLQMIREAISDCLLPPCVL